MTRHRARTSSIATLLALALAATALLAVPAISAACNGGEHGQTSGGPDTHRPDYVGWHHHHHHWFPGSEVGTVSSYSAETGKLSIALKNGETVTGLVTEDTYINCGSFGHDFSAQLRRHHGDHGDWGGPPSEGDEGCGTESLVAGAVVDGAMMHLEEGGPVFDAIFLAPTTTESTST
jgi:hypothetical protein